MGIEEVEGGKTEKDNILMNHVYIVHLFVFGVSSHLTFLDENHERGCKKKKKSKNLVEKRKKTKKFVKAIQPLSTNTKRALAHCTVMISKGSKWKKETDMTMKECRLLLLRFHSR